MTCLCKTHSQKVREFMEGCEGQPVRVTPTTDVSDQERLLRAKLVFEEALEFVEAMGCKVIPGVVVGDTLTTELKIDASRGIDLVEAADALLPDLIGVCGRAYSGKDTLANHLVSHYDYRRLGFADLVKEAVVAFDPFLYALSDGTPVRLSELRLPDEGAIEVCNRLKHDVHEVRRAMQAMGNEVGQGVLGSHVWIDAALATIQPGERVVISDVRYPHECKAISEVGGKVLRVTRPAFVNVMPHPSETQVDDCEVDCDVVNNSTIAAYVADALEALRGC